MKSTAVICGIDLGSWTIKIGTFSGDKFEVLTNEANFRQTPSLVGYTPTERLIGEAALIKLKTNFANTIRAPQRLFGLESHQYLLEEQLKNCHARYVVDKDITFKVNTKQGQSEITAEQALISLITKVNSIVQINKLHLSLAYIAVPTYYPQEARFSLLKSAEIALRKPVRILDDWISLGCHYTFTRIKELKTLSQMRHVIFLDFGYSHLTIYLVQFTQYEGRLLDWDYLPYTGVRNMDWQVCELLNQQFAKKNNGMLILKNPKATVKLEEAVQKQRSVLSANTEYQMNLEYLLGEEDLNHSMTREGFEDTIVSVLSDIAASMASFQSRNCSTNIHSLELMGGGSRIPCIQSMASKIFGLEPSRTLNQTQSIAMGTTIFGAMEHKLINMPYRFDPISTRKILVKWGTNKREIFLQRAKLPQTQTINFGNEGIIDLSLFFQHGMIQKQIGRIKFTTPNRLTFNLDLNKIITVKTTNNNFEFCELHHKAQQHWESVREKEEEMLKIDKRMDQIYEMKNNYESNFYWCKNKLEEVKGQVSQQIAIDIENQLAKAEHWVEEEHHHHSKGSEKDIQTFESKIKEIFQLRNLCEKITNKKSYVETLKKQYEDLAQAISVCLELPLTEQNQVKVLQIMNWGQQAYQVMQKSDWQDNALTSDKIEQARALLQILQRK